MLMKEIKGDISKWGDMPCSWIEWHNSKHVNSSKVERDLIQFLSTFLIFFCKYRQDYSKISIILV